MNMTNEPLVTVLLPVYNCEKYITESILSILNQTYTNFELLIIDDFSTDLTLQICKTILDKRIKIIEKDKNSGYTNSLNYGLSISKGKYVARMDGDDVSLPTRFEKQVAFLEENEKVIVCGTAFEIMDSGIKIIPPKTFEGIKIALLEDSCIAHPSVMMRSKTISENNIQYDIQSEPAEDFDLWVRLVDLGEFANLDEVLLLYRNHENQVSEKRKIEQRNVANEVKFKMISKLPLTIDNTEKEVYKKIFSFTEKLNLEEIYTYLNLKTRLLKANIDYFEKNEFIQFLNKLENKIVNQYFLGRKNFSPKLIIEFFKIKSRIVTNISINDIMKMCVKALLFYKVKSS